MLVKKIIFCFLVSIIGLSSVYCQHPLDKYKVTTNMPPQKVPSRMIPDGMVAGNGDIGVILGGKPDSLHFFFGKNDFWYAYPVYPGGIALPGGLDVIVPKMYGATYHAEQLPGTAEISGTFNTSDNILQIETWVTATDNLVIIGLISQKALSVKLHLWAGKGLGSNNEKGGKGDITWVTRSFHSGNLIQYETNVAIAMNRKNGLLHLQPGKKEYVAIALYTQDDTVKWKDTAIKRVQSLTTNDIQQLHKDHLQWWSDFWNLSSVSIHDEYLERYYYQSQYILASATRKGKAAPGIWGPFVTTDDMAWGGDYHLNYNYQAPYWACFSSNHIDMTDNFDQPLLDYMEMGRKHASELLNNKGIYYPVGIGPKGLCTTRWPLTPEEMYERYATYENTIDNGYKFLGQKINAVFSVGNMLMRFYSTYDKDYAQRVYPYLLACADFWEDYLTYEDGRYIIKMDHFYEIMPNKRNQGVWRPLLGDVNSTLSLGLVKMLFKGIVDMSIFLLQDEDRRTKWNDIIHNLSDYPTGQREDGRWCLKNTEQSAGNNNSYPVGLNRVSIHGLILPGGVVGNVTDPSFNKILISDISHWGDHRRKDSDWANTLGNGVETCYPGAVRVGFSSDSILYYLKERINMLSYPNAWIKQNGGGIETLSAVPMTINEMLLQSYEGIIRVFPNWNKKHDASFKDLRAYGAFLVSASLNNEKIESVIIKSEQGRLLTMMNPWPHHKVKVNVGKDVLLYNMREIISFPTLPNHEYHFSDAGT